MANGNGDYLSRFERVEQILERVVRVQEVQARNLTALLKQLEKSALDPGRDEPA